MMAQQKPAAKRRRNWLDTFTKLAVLVILINAIGWVWCSYGLAYLGRYEIAESLSETAIDAVIGVFIAYAVKSGVENISKYGVKVPSKKTNTTADLKRDY